jgi:hypothetical protein
MASHAQSNPQPGQQTLVTCLFDLERRERRGRRPGDFYFQHGRWLLAQPLPLVVFVDPELAPFVHQQRAALGLLDRTCIKPVSLESLPLYSTAMAAESWPTIGNGDPLKSTALHQLVEWSKFEFLRRVIGLNPFEQAFFAWVDFGIAHVAKPPKRFPHPTAGVALLQMKAVAVAEAADRRRFLAFERGHLAAGLMRGNVENLLALADAFDLELAAALGERIRPNEQMVLARMAAFQPELFSFYYGDYPSILSNWDYIRGDLETVLMNLSYCHQWGCHAQATAIARVLKQSLDLGLIRMDVEQTAHFLDLAFVAAWHSGEYALAREWQQLFLANCSHTNYERDNRRRLARNFALATP